MIFQIKRIDIETTLLCLENLLPLYYDIDLNLLFVCINIQYNVSQSIFSHRNLVRFKKCFNRGDMAFAFDLIILDHTMLHQVCKTACNINIYFTAFCYQFLNIKLYICRIDFCTLDQHRIVGRTLN